jgi:hypothetical protein
LSNPTECNPEHRRFTLGRPLWKLTLSSYDGQTTSLITFARMKQFGGTDKVTEIGNIACIAILTGINVSPVSTIAKELVASHMATCLAIDSDRESLLVTYPCEPVLAEAAKSYICDEYKANRLQTVFAPLLKSFRIGAIDRGHNGELVAKILLLLGHFKISKIGAIAASCKDVLQALYGNQIMRKVSTINESDQFSFNCFTELVADKDYWEISDAATELQLFFDRGTAIQLPKLQPGADLLLPIRRTENGGGVEYKYLLVQVKNYKHDLVSSELAIFKTKINLTFPSTSTWAKCSIGASIIINVGQPTEELYCDSNKSSNPHIYVVANGIGSTSYPGILSGKEKLEKSLKKMLREPSVDDWIVKFGSIGAEVNQKNDFNIFSPISRRPYVCPKLSGVPLVAYQSGTSDVTMDVAWSSSKRKKNRKRK